MIDFLKVSNVKTSRSPNMPPPLPSHVVKLDLLWVAFAAERQMIFARNCWLMVGEFDCWCKQLNIYKNNFK